MLVVEIIEMAGVAICYCYVSVAGLTKMAGDMLLLCFVSGFSLFIQQNNLACWPDTQNAPDGLMAFGFLGIEGYWLTCHK